MERNGRVGVALARQTHAREAPGREAIRNAAIALFAEKGFAATTTREICDRARVSKPVLYHHFGSKEQLFREILLDACNEYRKQLSLAAQRATAVRERLIEVFTADFGLTKRDPELSILFFRMIFAPKGEPSIDPIQSGMEWLQLVGGIVEQGVRRGELRGKPSEVAEAFMGIHMIYTMSYLLLGEPELDRRLAARIVKLVLDGCRRT
jgi:TetR/AcrR family transcriptional regulator